MGMSVSIPYYIFDAAFISIYSLVHWPSLSDDQCYNGLFQDPSRTLLRPFPDPDMNVCDEIKFKISFRLRTAETVYKAVHSEFSSVNAHC